MGFGTRNTCCMRNTCFDEMKKHATCGETGLGNYIYLCVSFNTCSPPWPGWCHVLSTQSEWGMEVIMWINLAEWTTHSNINCLVILGGSSLKPKELEWLPTLSISLDSCSPSCRQTWKCFPIWRVAPQQIQHTDMHAHTGARENRCGRGTGEGSRSLAFHQENLLAWPVAAFTLPTHQVCIAGARVIILWPWRIGLALSWTLVGRKDWADRHTSKGDTFFNLGFKKRTEKTQAQAKKFSFVMSIVFKNVIWPELEVLQKKNNLALFSPFSCWFQLVLSLVLH